MLIGGEWIAAKSGGTYERRSPATDEIVAYFADADIDDIDEAISRARSAFDAGAWRQLPALAKQHFLASAAQQIRLASDDLALIMALEGGKTLRDGAAETAQLASFFDYAAAAVRHIGGETITNEVETAIGFTMHEPVGVVTAITPYNFPVWTFGAKVAMALAAGCSIVLKPSPFTSGSALAIAKILHDLGLPAGVLNVVTTESIEASRRLTESPGVDAVSFTGSSAVGADIVRASASTFKRLTLELGGKSPNIVFDDADLDKFVESFFASIFFNAGQVCVAGSLVLVADEIYDTLVERLVAVAEATTVGNPVDAKTTMGPLISSRQRDLVAGFVDRAVTDGNQLLTGGRAVDIGSGSGWFFEPTIIAADDPSSEICQEEVFGPVATILRFSTEQEALSIANGTAFGLKAAVWTRDASRLLRMAKALRAGSVMGNAYRPPVPQARLPFGGFGQSGLGRELGSEGLLGGFMEVKTLMLDIS